MGKIAFNEQPSSEGGQMKEKSVVGDLINFRGLVYSPVNENGVIFIFGKVIEDLNMYIEEIKTGFPDCVGRRFMGRGWEKVYIEFEYKSSHFRDHGHDPKVCDLIVCWEHDWPECPVEVIELKEEIKTLPSKSIQQPDVKEKEYAIEDLLSKSKVTDSVKNLFQTFDKGVRTIKEEIKTLPSKSIQQPDVKEKEYAIEDLLSKSKVTDRVKNLFQTFDKEVRTINEEIWSKVAKTTVTYYSPERVFLYTYFQQQAIGFDLFTRGEKIDGVRNYDPAKDGAKWGGIGLRIEKDIPKVLEAVKRSYQLIREAIKNNEPTGWFAKLEEEGSEEVSDE